MEKQYHSQALVRDTPEQPRLNWDSTQPAVLEQSALETQQPIAQHARTLPLESGALKQAAALMCSLIQAQDWIGAEALLHHWILRSNNSREFHQLAGMMKRGQLIQRFSSLTPQTVRSWHFILTGGLLLCAPPRGKTSLPDDQTLYQQSLFRLQLLLKMWQLRIPRVLMLPDKRSKTLAHGVAQALDCPLEPWTPTTTRVAGLIPVSDLGLLTRSQRQVLSQHHSGQMLWSQRSHINESFVADLTSTFYGSRYGSLESAMTRPNNIQADQAALAALAQRIRPGEHGAAALRQWGDRLLSPISPWLQGQTDFISSM